MISITEKGEKTRQLIIQEATRLFTKYGYGKTSLNQILKATGLAKGGFYFHFKSKEELGIAVIKSLEECWSKEILPKMIHGKNAKQKLELIFSFPGDCNCENENRPTILLLTLATEMIEVNEKFANLIRQIVKGWWMVIAAIIEEGKQENLFKQELDGMAVAGIILCNILGANLLAILDDDSSIYENQLQHLKHVLFEGITIRSNHSS
ncbi:MAG: TetR/AcrR family transcriptional regulator [Calditrichaeota bacterium]|nr:MAG: TetR/AcrR family transcriptional regulator [Calditrichota bacterium]